MVINETIQSQELSGAIRYASAIPRYFTTQITGILTQNHINVTERWSSLLLFVISMLMVYLAIKISAPWIKWILIALGIVLLAGLILPMW